MEKLVSFGKMSQTKVPVNTNKTHVSVGGNCTIPLYYAVQLCTTLYN
jgi:hypothetical protein